MKLPDPQQAREDVAFMNAVSRRKYPSRGAVGDYLFYELVSYTDKLMKEVGLKSHRKGWWADWLEPCLASDFKEVRGEYQTMFGC